MHNCKTAHPGKTHRRRNSYLKHTLEPIRVTAQPLTASDQVTKVTAKAQEPRDKRQRDRRDTSVPEAPARPTDNTRRVEVAPASAIKNPVAWIKQRFTRKTG